MKWARAITLCAATVLASDEAQARGFGFRKKTTQQSSTVIKQAPIITVRSPDVPPPPPYETTFHGTYDPRGDKDISPLNAKVLALPSEAHGMVRRVALFHPNAKRAIGNIEWEHYLKDLTPEEVAHVKRVQDTIHAFITKSGLIDTVHNETYMVGDTVASYRKRLFKITNVTLDSPDAHVRCGAVDTLGYQNKIRVLPLESFEAFKNAAPGENFWQRQAPREEFIVRYLATKKLPLTREQLILWMELGYGHLLLDDVERWNEEHPDDTITFFTYTPKYLETFATELQEAQRFPAPVTPPPPEPQLVTAP